MVGSFSESSLSASMPLTLNDEENKPWLYNMLLRFTEFVVCLSKVKKPASQRLECLVPCHESGQNCKLCVSLKISWQSDWQPDSRNESRNLSQGFVSVSVAAWCLQMAHPYPSVSSRNQNFWASFPRKNEILSEYCRMSMLKEYAQEWNSIICRSAVYSQ